MAWIFPTYLKRPGYSGSQNSLTPATSLLSSGVGKTRHPPHAPSASYEALPENPHLPDETPPLSAMSTKTILCNLLLMFRSSLALYLVACLAGCSTDKVVVQDRLLKEHLPDHITVLHEGGERVDWSLDGDAIAFVTKEGGDLLEKNLVSGEVRDLSAHYDLGAFSNYYRIMYMADGNLILTGGPERYDAYMQILDPDLDREPYQMGVKVIEGPAVSRVTLPVKIAYCPEGQEKSASRPCATARTKRPS